MEVRELLKRAGGVAKVANACGLTRQAVYAWETIPVKHLAAVEAVSGLSKVELRPDLYRLSPEDEKAALRLRLAQLEAQG